VAYAAAEPVVAGAVDLAIGEHLELGEILDIAFFAGVNTHRSSSSSQEGGGSTVGVQRIVGDKQQSLSGSATPAATHHLAVLSQR
jgi:hypothetical protein